jgi:putative flippase GtrA
MGNLTDRARALYTKYRELILYVICGGLTTGVDFGIYWLCTRLGGIGEVPAQTISVAAAIVFAYIVNKRWVFLDKRTGLRGVLTQFLSFASMRVLSGAFQVASIWLFVEKMGLYDMAVKVAVSVAVILSNYAFSKLFIFRKQ